MSDFRSLTTQSGLITEVQDTNTTVVGSGIKTSTGDLTITPGSNVVVNGTLNLTTALSASGGLQTSSVTVTGTTTISSVVMEVFVDASAGPFTIKFPQSPTVGERHSFKDYKGYFDLHHIVLDGYGHNVEQFYAPGTFGSSALLNSRGLSCTYVYSPDSNWVLDGYVPGTNAAEPSTSGLILWAKSESLSGMTTLGGSSVWTDSSGNGNDFQGLNSIQVTAQNTLFNNYPSVFVNVTNGGGIATDTSPTTGAFSLFIVSNVKSSRDYGFLFSHATSFYIFLNEFVTGEFYVSGAGGANDGLYTNSTWAVGPGILRFTFDGTQTGQLAYKNGVSVPMTFSPSNSPGTTARTGRLGLGFFNGSTSTNPDADIAEVLYYNRVLSYDEIIVVEEYLRKKFNLY